MMIQSSGLCFKIHTVHLFCMYSAFFSVDVLVLFRHEGQRLF